MGDDVPYVITTREKSGGNKKNWWLVVRLLGGAHEIAAHPVRPEELPRAVLCAGPSCPFCRYKIERVTFHLVPVVYLLRKDDPGAADQWHRAALVLDPGLGAAIGTFDRGRVIRFHQRKAEPVQFVDEPAPGGAFDVPPFAVEDAYREFSQSMRGGVPRASVLAERVRYCPGDVVRLSGVYTAVHGDEHIHPSRVMCLEGEAFPPCRVCADQVRFRLINRHDHVTKHWLFSATDQTRPVGGEEGDQEADQDAV